MERKEFIEHIITILQEENWQASRGRTIKSSITKQRRAINALARSLKLEKLTFAEIYELSE